MPFIKQYFDEKTFAAILAEIKTICAKERYPILYNLERQLSNCFLDQTPLFWVLHSVIHDYSTKVILRDLAQLESLLALVFSKGPMNFVDQWMCLSTEKEMVTEVLSIYDKFGPSKGHNLKLLQNLILIKLISTDNLLEILKGAIKNQPWLNPELLLQAWVKFINRPATPKKLISIAEQHHQFLTPQQLELLKEGISDIITNQLHSLQDDTSATEECGKLLIQLQNVRQPKTLWTFAQQTLQNTAHTTTNIFAVISLKPASLPGYNIQENLSSDEEDTHLKRRRLNLLPS